MKQIKLLHTWLNNTAGFLSINFSVRAKELGLITGFLLSINTGIVAADVGQWDRFEASVKNTKGYNDPYKNVTLNVTYTRPNGSQIKFWGFYDGGTTWKIRFMPDQVGTWKYSATFTDGQRGISGTFKSVPSTIPGMLSKDEMNPRWFGYKGGKHELIRSFHCGYKFFSYSWDDPNNASDGNKRKVFLDWIQQQGYNTLSIGNHFMGTSRTGETQKLWPLNAAEYRKVETIMNDLAGRRMLIYPFGGFFRKGANYPTNPADQARYIKYALARFGAYWNIFWNVGGPEINLKSYLSSTEVKRLGNEISNSDVYDHPLGVHNKDGNDPYRKESWVSYVTLQGEYTRLSDLSSYLLKNHTGSMPVYAHETLWPGNTLQPFAKASSSTIRKHAWVHNMSAVALNFGDQKGTNSSGFSGSMEPADAIQSRHDVVKKVWDFFETIPFYRMNPCQDLVTIQSRHDVVKKVWDFFGTIIFSRMKPRQDLVTNKTGYCLAEVGKQYLVYLPSKGSVNVSVASDTTYKVTWINAQNPTAQRSAGTTSNGQGLTSPNEGDDWVLYLVSGGGSVANPTNRSAIAGVSSEKNR